MNTFWLKIMGLAVLALAVIIAISFFMPADDSESPQPEEPQKTFYDQAEEDRQKFLIDPQALDSQTQTPPAEQAPPTENQAPVQTVPKAIEPPKPAQPKLFYFKELDEIDQIEASKLLNVAVPGRSIGRLPTTG